MAGFKCLGVVLIFQLMACLPSGFAETTSVEDFQSLQAELEALKKGQIQIQKDLQEIKDLLFKGRTLQQKIPPGLELSIEGDPYKGSSTAPVTVIEFSDYQCPFCARHVRQTLPLIERDYIGTGKVKYVFRDFPLTTIHKQARQAAVAANCAGQQGKYWDMHDKLFANQKALQKPDLTGHAANLGLDLARFNACLEEKDQITEIQADMEEGRKAGVRGTPTFFIGHTNPKAPMVRPVIMLRGAQPFSKFQDALNGILLKEPESEARSKN